MANKIIKHNDDARKAVLVGLNRVANTVAVTLGPSGRNVLMKGQWGQTVLTKDGVTVARSLDFADPFESLGARMIQESASKTNDRAGDGTTTATVLTQALIREGQKFIDSDLNVVALREGIESATQLALKFIDDQARTISIEDMADLEHVATISGNDPNVGRTVAQAFHHVGKDGVVTFEDTKDPEDSIKYIEGLRFDRGWLSGYFITDPNRREAVLENPLIFLTSFSLDKVEDVTALLECASQNSRPLVVIAEKVDGDALSMMALNNIHHRVACVAVEGPGFGERRKMLMEDIAVTVGAKIASKELGTDIRNVNHILPCLGSADRVVVSGSETVIHGPHGKEATRLEYLDSLKTAIETLDSPYDREKYAERIAKMSTGIAVIKIGGSSEAELTEKRFRYEDAINSTKAAVEDGIVPGGGLALLKAQKRLARHGAKLPYDTPEWIGTKIVEKALEVPFRLIMENAGLSATEILNGVKKRNYRQGYDARKKAYRDFFQAGIIDPVRVTRSALQNAASVAGSFLTIESVVVDAPKDTKPTEE